MASLITPMTNFGKSTSVSDGVFYLLAENTPQRVSVQRSSQGGQDNLESIESQISDNTFLPMALPIVDTSRKKVIVYAIKEGDTVGNIAEHFNLKPNTILWANGLTATSALTPGKTLRILPVDGVLHTVKKGETLSSLSLTYKVYTESIIEANGLTSQGFIVADREIIIPGGAPLPPAPKKKSSPSSSERILADVRGLLAHPAPGAYRSQGLHWRNAVDLANGCGSPIVAAAAGTILKADGSGWNGGFGKYIMVQHAGGYVTVYGHLSQILVEPGQAVDRGSRIGSIGATGHATGCHVHFEVRGAENPFTR